MSRSYRTQKESIIARRRVTMLPRVIERPPAFGDIHPLAGRTVRCLFRRIPLEYLYGLARIELRPRQTAAVGQPFGCYLRDEKIVILYSVPPSVWQFPGRLPADYRRSFEARSATISQHGDHVRVTWPDEGGFMRLWYYAYVFTHELGHHYVEQYRAKNGRVGGRLFNKIVAEMHARRFTAQLFKRPRAATQKA